MVAMAFVLRVLRLAAGDDDGTDFVRNLDLRHCSVQECVFDFHKKVLRFDFSKRRTLGAAAKWV